uniref:uncharacterized protein LOC101311666 isoform X2 n=1 Tax=Fragaria vesca subsp. vesca TaxID=101020 RepID=UPI0005C81684|nr:PREDICTED: uncharacterized protein LOC101311666 isoform X2 [Fragaria vesca subsp. vesca]
MIYFVGMELGSRRSSIKNIVASKPFEDEHNVSGQLDDRMISPEERVENAPDNLCSFGQANYQRQKQGIIIEYKDFSDNTLQCNHCNAYYWRDERNTREVYTGCCKGGQVRNQSLVALKSSSLLHHSNQHSHASVHLYFERTDSDSYCVLLLHKYKIEVHLKDEDHSASAILIGGPASTLFLYTCELRVNEKNIWKIRFRDERGKSKLKTKQKQMALLMLFYKATINSYCKYNRL